MDQFKYVVDWNKNKWEQKNDEMYQRTGSENEWPWYFRELDSDVERLLQAAGDESAKILDLGTCSGAQAIALAKKGYEVVGSDISETAIAKAIEAASNLEENLKLQFLMDDILESKLASETFDYVLDRGCFHCVCYFGHLEYLANVHRILKPGGKLILKTMSSDEQRFRNFNQFGEVKIPMPEHFTEELIRKVFNGSLFEVEEVKDSFFYSNTINPPAKARLAVIHKK